MAITVINSSLVSGERHLRAIEVGKVFEIIQNKDHFKMSYVRPGESESSLETLFGDIKVINDQGVLLLDQNLELPGLGISKFAEGNFISLGFGLYLGFTGSIDSFDGRATDRCNGRIQIYQEIVGTEFVRQMGDLPLGVFYTPHWNPGSLGMFGHDKENFARCVEHLQYRHDDDEVMGIWFTVRNDGSVRCISIRNHHYRTLDDREINQQLSQSETLLNVIVSRDFFELIKLENWVLNEHLSKRY